MVCQGTRFFVFQELERLGFKHSKFEQRTIDFEKDLSLTEIKRLVRSLHKYGLELTFGKSKLVSEIQFAVIDFVENNTTRRTSFSYYISQRVGYDYVYLKRYFKKETGITIMEYYSEKKDEKMRLAEPVWSDALHPVGKSA